MALKSLACLKECGWAPSWMALLVWIVYILLGNQQLPLMEDSAYYWTWSLSLQSSYFDHPPMVAACLKFVTALFGSTPNALRLMPLLCWIGVLGLTYRLADELFENRRISAMAFWIAALLPVTQFEVTTVGPSDPESLFWMAALYSFFRATLSARRWHLLWTGLLIGCTLLSKYTGVLLALSLLILVFRPAFRGSLSMRTLLMALLLGVGLFAPVMIWNAQHHWQPFAFQLNHGLPLSTPFTLSHFTSFFAAQLYLVSPVFWVVLVYGLIQHRRAIWRNPRLSLIVLPCGIPLGLFLLLATVHDELGLWASPAYLSGTIFIAYTLEHAKMRGLYWAGLIISILIIVSTKFMAIDPHTAAGGYLRAHARTALIQAINRRFPNLAQTDPVIFSNTYATAAALQYGLNGHPLVVPIDQFHRGRYLKTTRTWLKSLQTDQLEHFVFIGDLGYRIQPPLQQFDRCKTRWSDKLPVNYGQHTETVIGHFALIDCWQASHSRSSS